MLHTGVSAGEAHADDDEVEGVSAEQQSKTDADDEAVIGWGAGTELKKIFKRFGFEPKDDL
jgi:hypothetical protein